METGQIYPETAAILLDKDEALLVDVRTPEEFSDLHAAPALNIPLDQLDEAEIDSLVQGKKLCIICQNGTRGLQAVRTLERFGFRPENVVGGTAAWQAAGLPVVAGHKAITNEARARVFVGVLTVAASIAATTTSPTFIVIPLIVGTVLTFTGLFPKGEKETKLTGPSSS
jgi:rhodanese-related sulfurtransferase